MPTTLAKLSWPLLNGPIKMKYIKYTVIKLDRKGHWVEVHSPDKSPTYSSVMTMTDAAMMELDAWVSKNNLGKRMAFNMWKLKNQAALNWFILKWS